VFEDIFKDKVVLVTGHTGFKGSWLSIWLTQLGAKVAGISEGEISNPSNFTASRVPEVVSDYRFDIRDINKLKATIQELQPDFVFHLAAQALVRPSYQDPLGTMMTNAMGSANVLEALRDLDKEVVAIMITSDKAYDNAEWVWGYRETDRLGGKDPYSASKGMAELVIRSYVESFFKQTDSNVRIGITRAGNVIGGGDWGVDRIIPDCVRAWSDGRVLNIRNPQATRPWQHVLEPLSGYLLLASDLTLHDINHGEAYNFGPNSDQSHSVSSLIDEMAKSWCGGKWKDISEFNSQTQEARLLKLNCDKALGCLGWRPVLDFEQTVMMTADWYKNYYQDQNQSMYSFTTGQIESYMQLFNQNI